MRQRIDELADRIRQHDYEYYVLDKARELGIRILNEKNFLELARPGDRRRAGSGKTRTAEAASAQRMRARRAEAGGTARRRMAK